MNKGYFSLRSHERWYANGPHGFVRGSNKEQRDPQQIVGDRESQDFQCDPHDELFERQIVNGKLMPAEHFSITPDRRWKPHRTRKNTPQQTGLPRSIDQRCRAGWPLFNVVDRPSVARNLLIVFA